MVGAVVGSRLTAWPVRRAPAAAARLRRCRCRPVLDVAARVVPMVPAAAPLRERRSTAPAHQPRRGLAAAPVVTHRLVWHLPVPPARVSLARGQTPTGRHPHRSRPGSAAVTGREAVSNLTVGRGWDRVSGRASALAVNPGSGAVPSWAGSWGLAVASGWDADPDPDGGVVSGWAGFEGSAPAPGCGAARGGVAHPSWVAARRVRRARRPRPG
jgi:hypothetical protein